MVPKRNKTCHTEGPLYTIAHSRGSAQVPPLERTHTTINRWESQLLLAPGVPFWESSSAAESCLALGEAFHGQAWLMQGNKGTTLPLTGTALKDHPAAELPRGPASLPPTPVSLTSLQVLLPKGTAQQTFHTHFSSSGGGQPQTYDYYYSSK